MGKFRQLHPHPLIFNAFRPVGAGRIVIIVGFVLNILTTLAIAAVGEDPVILEDRWPFDVPAEFIRLVEDPEGVRQFQVLRELTIDGKIVFIYSTNTGKIKITRATLVPPFPPPTTVTIADGVTFGKSNDFAYAGIIDASSQPQWPGAPAGGYPTNQGARLELVFRKNGKFRITQLHFPSGLAGPLAINIINGYVDIPAGPDTEYDATVYGMNHVIIALDPDGPQPGSVAMKCVIVPHLEPVEPDGLLPSLDIQLDYPALPGYGEDAYIKMYNKRPLYDNPYVVFGRADPYGLFHDLSVAALPVVYGSGNLLEPANQFSVNLGSGTADPGGECSFTYWSAFASAQSSPVPKEVFGVVIAYLRVTPSGGVLLLDGVIDYINNFGDPRYDVRLFDGPLEVDSAPNGTIDAITYNTGGPGSQHQLFIALAYAGPNPDLKFRTVKISTGQTSVGSESNYNNGLIVNTTGVDYPLPAQGSPYVDVSPDETLMQGIDGNRRIQMDLGSSDFNLAQFTYLTVLAKRPDGTTWSTNLLLSDRSKIISFPVASGVNADTTFELPRGINFRSMFRIPDAQQVFYERDHLTVTGAVGDSIVATAHGNARKRFALEPPVSVELSQDIPDSKIITLKIDAGNSRGDLFRITRFHSEGPGMENSPAGLPGGTDVPPTPAGGGNAQPAGVTEFIEDLTITRQWGPVVEVNDNDTRECTEYIYEVSTGVIEESRNDFETMLTRLSKESTDSVISEPYLDAPSDVAVREVGVNITGRVSYEIIWKNNSKCSDMVVIQRSDGTTSDFVEIGAVESVRGRFTDTGAEAEGAHAYRIFAINTEEGWRSPYSESVVVTYKEPAPGSIAQPEVAGPVNLSSSSKGRNACFGSMRSYREKRLETGASCYVATSAAGGEKMAIVEQLKWIREHGLKKGAVGGLSVDIYQAGSQGLASACGDNGLIRVILAGIAGTHGNAIMLTLLAVITLLIICRFRFPRGC